MRIGKYKSFSKRLIEAMISNGHSTSRSPSGICMTTLAKFAGASEQICRRYIRGDALPDYDKVLNIAMHLKVSPGWLLFGDNQSTPSLSTSKIIDEALLHYILSKSYPLYREEYENTDDYADFVLELIRDAREIHTSQENLYKIIDLAIGSISSYKEKQNKKTM